MTVSTTSVKSIGLGNGATTLWTYNFLINLAGDVSVIYTDAAGVNTVIGSSLYSITGLGNPAGGTVTYPLTGTGIANGTKLTISRNAPDTQLTDLVSQGSFSPDVVETGLDNIVLELQQTTERSNRALRVSIVETGTLGLLPPAASRANQFLGFDSSGNPIAGGLASAPISSVMQPVVAAASLATACQLLGADPSNNNPIINPDCAVVQLGPTINFIADNAYASDGTRVLIENASAANWNQSTTYASSGLLFADKLTAVGTTDKFGILKPMENKDLGVLLISGQTLVAAVSIATDGTSINNIKMAILVFTGTADAISGDPISSWGANGVTPTLAANWAYCNTPVNLGVTGPLARYSVTGTVPSGANNLALFIWNDDKVTTAADAMYFGNYDLRLGSTVQPFESVKISDNLARCQRYFWKTFPQATAPAQNIGNVGAITVNAPTGATGTFGVSVMFTQVMRIAPTITTFNPGAANANWRDTTNSADRVVTVDSANASDRSVMITGAAAVAAATMRIHLQADARL